MPRRDECIFGVRALTVEAREIREDNNNKAFSTLTIICEGPGEPARVVIYFDSPTAPGYAFALREAMNGVKKEPASA
jgi:hypothetical protein